MDEQIASFNAVTGNENADTAQFFLESSQNNVEAAINMYLESGGAMPGAGAAAAGNDDDMGGLEEESPAEEDEPPKMAVSNEQNPNNEEQRWYTGGPQGGSGQEVIAPGQGKDMMNNLMTELAPHGRTGTSDDLKAPSGAFTGSARTLDGQVKAAKKESKKIVVKLFANEVFTVDDGPPRDIYDPANTAFLNSIKRQEVPAELRKQHSENEVTLSLMQIPKDYDPADFPKPAFTGTGNRLDGGQASSSGASSSQAAAPPAGPWDGPDDSKPTTSIQIRLPDGSRLVGKFNLDQKIHEIRAFVASARPSDKRAYQMLTGFPQAPIPDESITIEAGGLKGSVVIFK